MHKTPTPRRPHQDGWTPARQRDFIGALCYGLSVMAATQTVGMSARSACRRRAHPAAAGFRAAWDTAVAPALVPRGPELLEKALLCLTAPIAVPDIAAARCRPAPAAPPTRPIARGGAGMAEAQKSERA